MLWALGCKSVDIFRIEHGISLYDDCARLSDKCARFACMGKPICDVCTNKYAQRFQGLVRACLISKGFDIG